MPMRTSPNRRSSCSTRPTRSSSTSLHAAPRGVPEADRRRTASKAYALAGLRVGFAIARPEVLARMNPYRPPGSVSTVSVTIVTEALLDPRSSTANLARVEARARPPGRRADRGGLVGRTERDELPPGRLRLAGRAAAMADGLLARGLVPRTFPWAVRSRRTCAHRPRPRERPLIEAARQLSSEIGATTPLGPSTSPTAVRGVVASAAAPARPRSTSRSTSMARAGDFDRGRLLRPPPDVARAPRPVRPRDPGDRRPRGRRAPHGRGRRARLGSAFAEALGDRAGSAASARRRCRWTSRSRPPWSTSVAGRMPVIDLPFRGERVGGLPLQLVEHALERSPHAGATLHLRGTGRNDHHLAEAAFKALARALRIACERDPPAGRGLDEGLALVSDAERRPADRGRRLRRRQPRQHRAGADRRSVPRSSSPAIPEPSAGADGSSSRASGRPRQRWTASAGGLRRPDLRRGSRRKAVPRHLPRAATPVRGERRGRGADVRRAARPDAPARGCPNAAAHRLEPGRPAAPHPALRRDRRRTPTSTSSIRTRGRRRTPPTT